VPETEAEASFDVTVLVGVPLSVAAALELAEPSSVGKPEAEALPVVDDSDKLCVTVPATELDGVPGGELVTAALAMDDISAPLPLLVAGIKGELGDTDQVAVGLIVVAEETTSDGAADLDWFCGADGVLLAVVDAVTVGVRLLLALSLAVAVAAAV
jgi:hypothetical protein